MGNKQGAREYTIVQKQPDQVQRFKGIMTSIFSTTQEEIDCNGCYTRVDEYVDMLNAGQDPALILPEVKAHLTRCGACHEEFEALIQILEAQARDDN